jgi:hypothetical protein
MLDALHRADRMRRIELRPVKPRAPDEQSRQGFLMAAKFGPARPAPAQNLKSSEFPAHFQFRFLTDKNNLGEWCSQGSNREGM